MNFCFVINNLLSASSQPGKNRRLNYYLELYKENNIKVLISLHKKLDLPDTFDSSFKTYLFKYNQIAVTPEKIDEVVEVILKHVRKNEPVNVNCEGGITESGTILTATLMKYLELSYKDAFKRVSEHRFALGDDESTNMLIQYEKFLANKNRVSA